MFANEFKILGDADVTFNEMCSILDCQPIENSIKMIIEIRFLKISEVSLYCDPLKKERMHSYYRLESR